MSKVFADRRARAEIEAFLKLGRESSWVQTRPEPIPRRHAESTWVKPPEIPPDLAIAGAAVFVLVIFALLVIR